MVKHAVRDGANTHSVKNHSRHQRTESTEGREIRKEKKKRLTTRYTDRPRTDASSNDTLLKFTLDYFILQMGKKINK